MKEKKIFNKKDWLIIFVILIIALFFRLYKINIPLADFHSWRQVDTAAVARNFLRFGFDLFHPRFDDLSSIQSGKENPEGFRMVEFPLYNAIFAFLYKVFPFFSLEVFGRLTSIFFSLISIAIIYYLALKEIGRIAAFLSAITFSIMPFFVYYTRIILPEPTALSFGMISIFFLYHFQQEKNKIKKIFFYLISLICFSSSLLIKPTMIFYSIPLIFLFFKKDSFYFLEKFYFYLYFFASILPLIFWRIYILNYPEGIPAYNWLITSVNTDSGQKDIFFRPAFFRWIFFERINNLICGGYLTFFLILGIIDKKKSFLILSFFISSLLYLFIFQGGNVQHEYYQILILPTIAFLIGKGITFLLENKNKITSPIVAYFTVLFFFGFSFYFSFEKVRNNYNYPQDLVTIANIVKRLTLPEDKIVTDRQGDTTLLYLMDRRGAPALYRDIEDLKKLGYTYLVSQNKDLVDKLKNNYQIVFESSNFALIKL